MYKHLNIPDVETTRKPSTDDKVLGILASKEVPNKTKDEVYSLDLAQKFDAKITTDDLSKAPFKQVKRSELDTKSKEKVKLKRQQDRDGIKTRKIEVMPLPPGNYERLKVQQINLTESMELQKQQVHRMKEVQIQNAMDKLVIGNNVQDTSKEDDDDVEEESFGEDQENEEGDFHDSD